MPTATAGIVLSHDQKPSAAGVPKPVGRGTGIAEGTRWPARLGLVCPIEPSAAPAVQHLACLRLLPRRRRGASPSFGSRRVAARVRPAAACFGVSVHARRPSSDYAPRFLATSAVTSHAVVDLAVDEIPSLHLATAGRLRSLRGEYQGCPHDDDEGDDPHCRSIHSPQTSACLTGRHPRTVLTVSPSPRIGRGRAGTGAACRSHHVHAECSHPPDLLALSGAVYNAGRTAADSGCSPNGRTSLEPSIPGSRPVGPSDAGPHRVAECGRRQAAPPRPLLAGLSGGPDSPMLSRMSRPSLERPPRPRGAGRRKGTAVARRRLRQLAQADRHAPRRVGPAFEGARRPRSSRSAFPAGAASPSAGQHGARRRKRLRWQSGPVASKSVCPAVPGSPTNRRARSGPSDCQEDQGALLAHRRPTWVARQAGDERARGGAAVPEPARSSRAPVAPEVPSFAVLAQTATAVGYPRCRSLIFVSDPFSIPLTRREDPKRRCPRTWLGRRPAHSPVPPFQWKVPDF